MTQDTFLMCPPDFFEVAYVINPWMVGHVATSVRSLAQQQWQALVDDLARFATVKTMTAQAGVPDLVFTANAGVVLGNKVVLSRFRHPERQQEEPHFRATFMALGFEVVDVPAFFEGAGDALFDRAADVLWFGFGHRSDRACAHALSVTLNVEVLPLCLVDPRFYHLDTCFCPLPGGVVMVFPPAFDAASQAQIKKHVPEEKRIVVTTEDAEQFACNAVSAGQHVFLHHASPALTAQLVAHGFIVHVHPLTEFLKAGGAAKCLTLKLNEPGVGG